MSEFAILSVFFIPFIIYVIFHVMNQKQWFIENSPLEWKKYSKPKYITITDIKNLDNLNILQSTDDSFNARYSVKTETGLWEYKYNFKIKNNESRINGISIYYYDHSNSKHNRLHTYGIYESS